MGFAFHRSMGIRFTSTLNFRNNSVKSSLILFVLTAMYAMVVLTTRCFHGTTPISNTTGLLTYKLDCICAVESESNSRIVAARTFQNIYDKNLWQSPESRSGGGSNIKGAIEWILGLKYIVTHYGIRYVADIPCGDTNWQFASREMNTLPFYFGGDIASGAVVRNQKLYHNHANKIFSFWDIVRCSLPRFSIIDGTKTIATNRTFDLVIMRDVIQHINILNALTAVKSIIFSEATYFLVSSYVGECVDFCRLGNITDGGFYHNNINCPPFNFPIPLFKKPSHDPPTENDEMHLYKIDDVLKDKARNFDQSCK